MDRWQRLFMREADALRFLLQEEFSMNVTTTTVMIAGHFDSLAEFAEYVNDLAGDRLAEYEGYVMRRVAQFQIIPQRSGLDAALLVELDYMPHCDDLADAEAEAAEMDVQASLAQYELDTFAGADDSVIYGPYTCSA